MQVFNKIYTIVVQQGKQIQERITHIVHFMTAIVNNYIRSAKFFNKTL